MKTCLRWLMLLSFAVVPLFTAQAQARDFKVIAFYSTNVEPDHVAFAQDAIAFFNNAASKDNFQFDTTTNWDDLNDAKLRDYQVVLWLNEFPHNAAERVAFEKYMTNGGAWLGFHVSAYNDPSTKWPWLVNFLGGTVFYGNSWPPLPAKLVVDDPAHPITRGIPVTFQSPANEWYIWKPSARLNKDVHVLVTLDPSNYPLGLKDILTSGDIPVVWTNTKYKMVYMNMGHGDKIFTEPIQNRLIENALLWLGRGQ